MTKDRVKDFSREVALKLRGVYKPQVRGAQKGILSFQTGAGIPEVRGHNNCFYLMIFITQLVNRTDCTTFTCRGFKVGL